METVSQVTNAAPASASRIEQILKLDLSNHSRAIYTFFNFLIVVGLIVAGFALKEDELLTAENGLGYMLGIVGASLMLLLIIYPIRKKMKSARFLGSVRFWFKTHMFFGIAGPLAILYHSNFGTGSLNSTVALFCMIIVASSGIVGRYFYSRIHYGLYGKKATLAGLLRDMETEKGKLLVIYNIAPELKVELTRYQVTLKNNLTLGESIRRFFVLGPRIRLASVILPYRLKKIVRAHAQKYNWTPLHTRRFAKLMSKHVRYYLQTSIKVCEFAIYERLFALWHTFHFPLFIMMIITGIIHVIAVHMY